MDIEDGWSEDVLPKISPFEVLWEQTGTVAHVSKAGVKYEKKKIVVVSRAPANYKNAFGIEVASRTYQALRLLNLAKIVKYSATEGIADVKGFRPIFYAGVKGLDSVA